MKGETKSADFAVPLPIELEYPEAPAPSPAPPEAWLLDLSLDAQILWDLCSSGRVRLVVAEAALAALDAPKARVLQFPRRRSA